MTKSQYLIIGGGVAGTTAADVIRAADPDGSITLVSEEPYPLYSRILLSKPTYFLGKIPFDSIWLKKEAWYGEKKITLIKGAEATKLDVAAKTVTLDNGTVLGYEKLLLSIGGCARPWGITGSEKKGIQYLRTIDDAKTIMSALKDIKRAVCIGSGFISFEMCEMLRMAGAEVTVIMRENYFWEVALDRTSGMIIEDALKKGGAAVLPNTEVAEILGTDAVTGVILNDGRNLDCDMVVVGIGIVCPYNWLKMAGVNVNRAILTNEYLETNIPDVWAAGDAAEFKDVVLNDQVQLGNWINAQSQGRAVGANMTGARKPFRMVSFYTAQGFGITIAFVGDIRSGADKKSIMRTSAGGRSHVRLFVKNNHLCGATLINKTTDLSPILRFIDGNLDISEQEAALADPSQELKTILESYS